MHGTWSSRLTMPMWLRGVPAVQTTARQLVVHGCEERGAGVAHDGHDALGAVVHQRQHVVGALHPREPARDRRRVEHLGPPSQFAHPAAD